MQELVTVLGGGGYIGAHLVRKLLNEDYRVRVFDSFVFGKEGVEGLELSSSLEIITGDVCDIKALSSAISGADTVVLLAAMVGRRVDEFSPKFMREVNLLASSVALDASIEHGVTRFVFASTDSVYGVQSGIMYETGTPAPVSLYSRLKLRMEEQVVRSKRRNFHPTALRISTCYGLSPRMRFDLVINSLIRDAVLKKELIIDSGAETRAYIHVSDAAQGILSCMRSHVSLISGEVFNISAEGQEPTLNQLANVVKQVVPDVSIVIQEGKPELTGYRLSCSKVAKILDFKAERSIISGMEEVKGAILEGVFANPYDRKYTNTVDHN